MKGMISTIVVLALFLGVQLAYGKPTQCPSFDTYHVNETFAGPYADLDVNSSPTGKRFKSVIRNSYVKKPNFAGRYRVVSWGCGSNCHVFVLVDTKTGKIINAPGPAALDAEYHVDSALFIIDPPDLIKESGSDLYATEYFFWAESAGEFRPLKSCVNSAQQGTPERSGTSVTE